MNGKTNFELIGYKTGFVAGRQSRLEAYELGKIANLEEEEKIFRADSWLRFGFEDGFNYFDNLIANDEADIDKYNAAKTSEIIEECYAKRVMQTDKENNLECTSKIK